MPHGAGRWQSPPTLAPRIRIPVTGISTSVAKLVISRRGKQRPSTPWVPPRGFHAHVQGTACLPSHTATCPALPTTGLCLQAPLAAAGPGVSRSAYAPGGSGGWSPSPSASLVELLSPPRSWGRDPGSSVPEGKGGARESPSPNLYPQARWCRGLETLLRVPASCRGLVLGSGPSRPGNEVCWAGMGASDPCPWVLLEALRSDGGLNFGGWLGTGQAGAGMLHGCPGLGTSIS